MTGLDRRQVLESVSGGAGLGLAGFAGARQRTDRATERRRETTTGADKADEKEVETTFTATAGSGCLTIGGSDFCDEDASMNVNLDEIDGEIVIDGTIYGDDTWDSDDVAFPNIPPGELIDADDFDSVKEISFDPESEITVLTNTISGVYDRDAGTDGSPLVTGSLDMEIEVDASGTAILDIVGEPEAEFQFNFDIDINGGENIELTTDHKEGEAENLHCADPVVVVVNDKFDVPKAKPRDPGGVEECVAGVCINVNDELGLPSPGPFANFVQLELDITWTGDQPWAPDVSAGKDGGRPRDLDCDGLYEDTDGDRELTVLDVQTLFANRDDPEWEKEGEHFDFADDGKEITIFDVQALYAMLEESDE